MSTRTADRTYRVPPTRLLRDVEEEAFAHRVACRDPTALVSFGRAPCGLVEERAREACMSQRAAGFR
jgi:hypothetical protein